jgi:replication-associated recombination protein RarA
MSTNNTYLVKQIMSGTYKECFVFEPDDSPIKDVPKIPGDIYQLISVGGPFGHKVIYKPLDRQEKYVDISSGTVGEVLKRSQEFFSEEVKKKYAELGIAHKTGVILYGVPGTGKTVTSLIIMRQLIKKYDAICLVISKLVRPESWQLAVSELNKTGRPIIIFCDECEQMFKEQEVYWLTFLDGHQSITNFMFIGCTNYLHHISPRIKRPSRIEHLIEVRSIEEEVATAYVEDKVGGLSSNTKAALVHYAMNTTTTIDAFKNAVKEFYIYHDVEQPKAFEKILKSYIREDLKLAKIEVDDDDKTF